MDFSLEEYKEYLVSKYMAEYDNNEIQRQKRWELLNRKYSDEYLESILEGTSSFIKKIIELSNNNYCGYIEIPLEYEPSITYIDLNLMGGWSSYKIVKDSNNNFYSIGLLKKVFGGLFIIDPCKVGLDEELDEDEKISILSEIPSYSLYIQCEKEIIDSVKETKVLKITKK